MEAETAKYITMFLLAGVSIILGFLPIKIGPYFFDDERLWKKTVTSSLLCFGGGVLFATSFIHMLPEVRENIEASGLDFKGAPMAEILLCAGFFLIYLIEEGVHFCLDSDVHHHHDETIQVHRSFSIHSAACEAGLVDVQNCASPRLGSPSQTRRRRTISYPANLQTYKTFSTPTGNDVGIGRNEQIQIAKAAAITGGSHQQRPRVMVAQSTSSSDNETCDTDGSPFTKSALRDFFTVLALSFHAVFEGLAVGLETEANDVWLLFAAVATHKYVISFCVGLELANSRTRFLLYSAYMITFAILSPIGIGIGIGITRISSEGPTYFMTVGVLQALAGGTIIYVVVFEVLERERSKEVSGLAQLLFVILGFSVLMSVELLAGHNHGHDHDHDLEKNQTTTTFGVA